ncbi:MAG: 23S rRNA (adenine(2030)-N(6))-methyltransferase RlmJ [Opitutaceae bacterium]|jgi:23S rRNA (adenine2030-N6)-methyltransferase|nr:23S rRNA (adenine(2030)-N(6))-methyltransferase RlmJ [Opitutaceae bacterium]
MNYRHRFHAGNFADVAKHALLVQLLRGFQRKEKGFLYLDTHAGCGGYDLRAAARGDSLARAPEHPAGIGRLAGRDDRGAEDGPISEYVELVRRFDREARGEAAEAGGAAGIRFYPGSPALARLLLRPQDRMALCEKHPEEFAALREQLGRARRVSLHEMDGYTAVRAMLPAPEKRALVLIDPPFEERDEFARIAGALAEGLRRAPGAAFAVWYPLTERARADAFLDEIAAGGAAPAFAAELSVAGGDSPLRMRGCGVAVLNPPWQIDRVIAPMMRGLAGLLAQGEGGAGGLRWLTRGE